MNNQNPTVSTENLLDGRALVAEAAQSIDAALRLDTDPDPSEGPMDTAVAVQLVLDLRREADRLAEYLLAHSVPVPPAGC